MLAAGAVVHAFSDRAAGNFGMQHGDEPEIVQERRAAFVRSLGFELSDVARANQVHGDRVVRVRRGDAATEADALVTDDPGTLLMLLFADCVPVLLWGDGEVAAAHAGWKGTALAIAAKTVAAMSTHPDRIHAVIGPSIGQCCYEVGPEVADAVGHALPGPRGRPHVDLAAANLAQLIAAGIHARKVAVTGICTACHVDRYFSHRAEEGRTGRFAGAIGLKE